MPTLWQLLEMQKTLPSSSHGIHGSTVRIALDGVLLCLHIWVYFLDCKFYVSNWNDNIYHICLPKIWSRDLFSTCSSMCAGPVHYLPEYLRLLFALSQCSVTTCGTTAAITLTHVSSLCPPGCLPSIGAGHTWEETGRVVISAYLCC